MTNAMNGMTQQFHYQGMVDPSQPALAEEAPKERNGEPTQADPPIFIFGIARRSGTNFLFQLLLLHKACFAGEVVLEDFFLAHADLLERYTNAVYHSWDRTWQAKLASPNLLLSHLGQGLISFLIAEAKRTSNVSAQEENRGKRVVTKTPSVQNLARCFELFPTVKPIVIVRDGRAVVESGVRSFRRNYEDAAHEWATAAVEIQSLLATQPADHYLLVRYEDLQQDTEAQMRKILRFLDLDPADYDFAAMRDLPIFGSSQIVSEGQQRVHWGGNTFENFDPNKRWQDWDQALHERFNRIAGAAMTALGYTLQPNRTPQPFRFVRLTWYTLRWHLWKRVRPVQKFVWRQWAKVKRLVR